MTFPPIAVRQPQPFDIVDVPVRVCGVGTGFEGVFSARVRDANGAQLALVSIHAGGSGILGNDDVAVALPATPGTTRGTVEVFEFSAKGDGTELNKVSVPVAFGPALVTPYHGFEQHTVVSGDTLSALAQKAYGNAALFRRIFDANRDVLSDPNLISVGQVLRIPV